MFQNAAGREKQMNAEDDGFIEIWLGSNSLKTRSASQSDEPLSCSNIRLQYGK
jgi:hypothetical protein